MFTKTRFEAASEAERKSYLFQRHPAVIALGYWFTFLHGMCIQPGLASPKKHWDSWLAVLLHALQVLVRDVRVCRVEVALLAVVLPNTLAFGLVRTSFTCSTISRLSSTSAMGSGPTNRRP